MVNSTQAFYQVTKDYDQFVEGILPRFGDGIAKRFGDALP